MYVCAAAAMVSLYYDDNFYAIYLIKGTVNLIFWCVMCCKIMAIILIILVILVILIIALTIMVIMIDVNDWIILTVVVVAGDRHLFKNLNFYDLITFLIWIKGRENNQLSWLFFFIFRCLY